MSSSSSPKMNQPTKVSQFQESIFKKPNSSSSSSMKVKSLIKRQETVFKKAYELSVLCGIEVCVICYGPDGELKIWPEDREKVEDMARRYSELSKKQRLKRGVGLQEFLQKINNDRSKKKIREVKRGSKVKYPVWDTKFDNYSVDQLAELYRSLERNRTRIQHRLNAVVESQGQRKIQNTNMVNQELMMTTSMNHLQQHPNQVSMYMFNHGNGSLSQIPLSVSALNQAQSLAPILRALTNYSISNVGTYSGLLGVQETGISGFQNMNMITYNNNSVNDFSKQIDQNPIMESYFGLLGLQQNGINEVENTNTYSFDDLNNFNVDDYLGFLGIQGTGTNVLGNMNMYDNNIINTNGSSHQLAQFPSQTPAPGFQFGSAPGFQFGSAPGFQFGSAPTYY